MTVRSAILGALTLLVANAILIGCATTPRPPRTAHIANAKLASGPNSDSEAQQEKRIRGAAHYAAGLAYELNDKPDLALDEMFRAAQSDPSDEPVVIEAVRRCIRAKKPERAVELLTKATRASNASGSLYAWLGLAYAQAGKTNQAIVANRTAIKKSPQSLAPYQNLAQIYLQSSRTNDALHVLDEAAHQTTDDPGFLIDLAELYSRLGHGQTGQSGNALSQRVRGILDRAADLNPTDPMQVLRLAETYFGLGELTKAEPFYRQLLEEHPDSSNLRSKLTEIYLRSGQKEKAAQQLEALAQSEPTNPQAYIFLGTLAVDAKKPAEAAAHFERAIKLDPDLELVYYELAGLKLTMKPPKPEEALAVLEKAHARFKMSFPMEFYTALAYSALEKYPEALNNFTSAEAIARATDPSRLTHPFYFQVGATHERAGHIEEAEKSFRECLKLAPDDPEALNYLGYMWAEHGVKLDEARSLIEKAVHLEPDNAMFLDSLAWVLFKLNQPAEALASMLKAIEQIQEPDATLYDHLGDIYSALKRLDQARDAWTKSLKVKPNDQVQKKLEAAPTSSHPPP